MPDVLYPPAVASAQLATLALGLRLRTEGAGHIPRSGPVVLAGNHVSYVDFAFLALAAAARGRKVRFLAKQDAFSNPVAGRLMRGMRQVPVDRRDGGDAYDQAVGALRDGEAVGIFPEGTFSRSFEVRPLRSGAARMAIEGESPLVPVVVFGPQRILHSLERADLTPFKAVTTLVGAPLKPGPGDDPREVTAALHACLTKLLDEAIGSYPDLGWGRQAKRWWLPQRWGGGAPLPAEVAAEEEAAARGDHDA
jgi:1-acyl-sn-glycerol-3-phosphate acyltransferase